MLEGANPRVSRGKPSARTRQTKRCLLFLPDKPLEGSGSLSDWMGRAGDLSREPAPALSHAQLSAHSRERSIPNPRLGETTNRAKEPPRKESLTV